MQPDARATSRPIPDTVGAAVRLAVDGLLALGELGEEVEDEWQYVQDLVDAWRTRLDEVEAGRDDEVLPPVHGAAIARAVDEAELITDPHKAIDWLSTLPQVVLVALAERP